MEAKDFKFLKDNNDFTPEAKTIKKIQTAFKGEIIGRKFIFLKSTTSTNDEAIKIGEKMRDPEGFVIIADAQRRGRGRVGRSWFSPPGVNLYFTVLLKPSLHPSDASTLTLMAAVAVVSAIRKYVGLKVETKWPNDIVINNKKAGGILLEMKCDKDKINYVAIGIGINVNMPLDMFPDDIRPLATSLKEECGKGIDRIMLLGRILEELEKYYKLILRGDKDALRSEWIGLNSTVGNNVVVQTPKRVISGFAEGIDEDGKLIVRLSSGDIEKISTGDVTILNPKHQKCKNI